MKLKKITAAVLAAALMATSLSIAGFAEAGAPKLTLLNDAADSLKQRSNLIITAASESPGSVATPSNPGEDPGNNPSEDPGNTPGENPSGGTSEPTPSDPEKEPTPTPTLVWADGKEPVVTVEIGETSAEYKFTLKDSTDEVKAVSGDDKIAAVALNKAKDAVTVTGVAEGNTGFTVTAGELTIKGSVTVTKKAEEPQSRFEWSNGKKEREIEIQLGDPNYPILYPKFYNTYGDQLNVKVDDPSIVKVVGISDVSNDHFKNFWSIELQGLKVGTTKLEISPKEAPEEKISITVHVIENIVVEPFDMPMYDMHFGDYEPKIPEGLDPDETKEWVLGALSLLGDNMELSLDKEYTESCEAVIDSLDMDSLPELRKEIGAPENSDVYVILNYEFRDMVLEAKDGKPHIKSITFDITPYVTWQPDKFYDYEEDAFSTAAKVLDSKYLKKSMQIMIPVPEKEIVPEKNAYVSHSGDGRKNYPISENADGARLVNYTTSHFSTFTLEFNNDAISSGTGSGSSGGSSSSGAKGSQSAASSEPDGAWVAGAKGWWYRYKDGTYPSNGWRLLEWQGKNDWYYFNEEGYMVSGWFTDVDGHRYFLHDKMDGTQGYMYTGWHLIDGKWYYFSTVSGGPLGSLLVNTTTPDGYTVGADGVWIQ